MDKFSKLLRDNPIQKSSAFFYHFSFFSENMDSTLPIVLIAHSTPVNQAQLSPVQKVGLFAIGDPNRGQCLFSTRNPPLFASYKALFF